MTPTDAADPGLPDPALAAAKDELRRRRIAGRAAMTDAEREHARAAIRDLVLARVASAGWDCVAAYVPLRTEPGSAALLERLAEAGVRVLVPITLPDRDLDWTEWTMPGSAAALGKDAIGGADAVLVPALAVATSDGTRLGRGGGSYDRALLRRRPGAAVAALLFDGEMVNSLPSEPWDVPVSAVATPSGWTPIG